MSRLCKSREWVGDFDYVARNSNGYRKKTNTEHQPKKKQETHTDNRTAKRKKNENEN